MSMVSVIAAIFVSITLSATIVLAVVCCRHAGPNDRRRQRRLWLLRRFRGVYSPLYLFLSFGAGDSVTPVLGLSRFSVILGSHEPWVLVSPRPLGFRHFGCSVEFESFYVGPLYLS